jgi:phage N-6-adenine-methyltransferase
VRNKEALFTSNSDLWATPQDLFDKLNSRFHFVFDAAASAENAKCDAYYNEMDDALTQDWTEDAEGGWIWLNPPFSKMREFMAKCAEEASKGAKIVALVPSRSDTRWFHESVLGNARLEFVKGRLKFNGSKNSAPFPSMLCIFNGIYCGIWDTYGAAP